MLIYPHELVVFDLETTDIDLGPPEIVEIGAVFLNTTLDEVARFSKIVRPTKLENFNEFCQKYTGITLGEVEAAKPFVEVWREFAEFTKWNNAVLAAWGTHFDVAVLREEYRRATLSYPHKGMPFDVKSAVQYYCAREGYKPKTWGLWNVARKFEVPVVEPGHRGLNDALTTVGVLRHISA